MRNNLEIGRFELDFDSFSIHSQFFSVTNTNLSCCSLIDSLDNEQMFYIIKIWNKFRLLNWRFRCLMN